MSPLAIRPCTTRKKTITGTDWGGIMAGSTLIAVPVIVFFLVVQGRMASGLTAGAVKG